MRKCFFLTLMLVMMAFIMPCQAQNQKLKLAVYATVMWMTCLKTSHKTTHLQNWLLADVIR